MTETTLSLEPRVVTAKTSFSKATCNPTRVGPGNGCFKDN